MAIKTRIGFQNIKLVHTEHAAITNEILSTDAVTRLIEGDDNSIRINEFNFVLRAEVDSPSDDVLDIFVPGSGIKFDRTKDGKTIEVFSRHNNHFATIRVSDAHLTIEIHYSNFKRRSVGVKVLADLANQSVQNCCIHDMIKLLDKVIPNFREESTFERARNLSQFYQALIFNFLKNSEDKNRIEKLIESQYRAGLIKGGSITRLRRLFRSTVDQKFVSDLCAIKGNLLQHVPKVAASEDASVSETTSPAKIIHFA